ncbi:hypothetical protein E2562_034661 [Oryza meyeriana var. granulata]|uniref:Uncharacterized protein n=1 Tax=Oryza meyeriana var. granulata TaxID=110450 RepID=A0A6G1ECA7_9ORYZ|nr:hypothetical protein E2562_034661 [Oryza meyeriana var. granulata]
MKLFRPQNNHTNILLQAPRLQLRKKWKKSPVLLEHYLTPKRPLKVTWLNAMGTVERFDDEKDREEFTTLFEGAIMVSQLI